MSIYAQHGRSSDTPRAFDVVALIMSAGGLEALGTVLRDLPPDFPAAVLVAQHLSGQGSALVEILNRHTQLPVSWIGEGTRLAPGQVQVCPPRRRLEVLPDRMYALSALERGLREYPLDFFLTSLADSFGSRVLAVVLTGMGKDGTAGARAIKQAGGTVLVQSEETAEQTAMPRAVIKTGAVDVVLLLHEIGPSITKVLTGGRFPRPRTEVEATEALFAGPGEARAALRAVEWA